MCHRLLMYILSFVTIPIHLRYFLEMNNDRRFRNIDGKLGTKIIKLYKKTDEIILAEHRAAKLDIANTRRITGLGLSHLNCLTVPFCSCSHY